MLKLAGLCLGWGPWHVQIRDMSLAERKSRHEVCPWRSELRFGWRTLRFWGDQFDWGPPWFGEAGHAPFLIVPLHLNDWGTSRKSSVGRVMKSYVDLAASRCDVNILIGRSEELGAIQPGSSERLGKCGEESLEAARWGKGVKKEVSVTIWERRWKDYSNHVFWRQVTVKSFSYDSTARRLNITSCKPRH
jgi:hypothetical protein